MEAMLSHDMASSGETALLKNMNAVLQIVKGKIANAQKRFNLLLGFL